MKPSLLRQIGGSLRHADQWLRQTPDRSLDQAYEAALMIKAIEDEHFHSQKISADTATHSETVLAYFQTELQQHLTTVKVRLAEFKLSHPIVSFFSSGRGQNGHTPDSHGRMVDTKDGFTIVLEKLQFIDGVVAKYTPSRSPKSLALIPKTINTENSWKGNGKSAVDDAFESAESISDQTGVLPRSILGTLSRIQRNLDPKAEAEVVQSFRADQTKTFVAIRFILFLILVTIGAQVVTKTLIAGPIVDRLRPDQQVEVFLNQQMEAEALEELQQFEADLKFRSLIGQLPKLTPEELEDKLAAKATEIAQEFRQQGGGAVKNIFSDLASVIAFGAFIVFNKRDVATLKSFIDEIVYGLSDSAKAFIIILFTDIFVGFHSTHGWEVILEGAAKHLGLPENRDFIFIFIATFPVILDTVFKYWIFRYLNRVSPSAVATLRNMNE
ncbi:proton extrusion protein PcxA [Neosynechococcus sphagnicola sy1]|uniref:Proton extrusion protein PxcA n=1 Tax=Neosynechococcus sphagnicola sy1 TaxID=1497020 RepID=A0A098TJZ7_9CYAN|nr:proton extrusion protein PcxA [Neosynechococcus sphagnicola]KGF72591.1 proton extrusion protein PcxA [Neosynechococcus sphagnicola sy1]